DLRRRAAERYAIHDPAHEPTAEAHSASGAFPQHERVRLFAGDVADLVAFSVDDRHSDERTTPPSGQTETPPGASCAGRPRRACDWRAATEAFREPGCDRSEPYGYQVRYRGRFIYTGTPDIQRCHSLPMWRATPRLEPHGPLPPLRIGRTGRAFRVRRLRAAVRPRPDDPGGARHHETGDRGPEGLRRRGTLASSNLHPNARPATGTSPPGNRRKGPGSRAIRGRARRECRGSGEPSRRSPERARSEGIPSHPTAGVEGDRESRRPAQVCARGDDPRPRRGGR